MPSDVTVLISLNGETGAAWAIEIDSQETHENYVQIGSMTFGHVCVVAPQYGRGRTLSFESNTQVFTSLDGTTHTRNFSRGRRTASISWTDGVDTSAVNGTDPNPDYWQFSNSSGAEPVSNYGDAPMVMLGLYDYLRGSNQPIVYLPSFKKSESAGGDVIVLNRRNSMLYGRTTGAVSIDHVIGSELQGDKQDGEIFRIASINIAEIE